MTFKKFDANLKYPFAALINLLFVELMILKN